MPGVYVRHFHLIISEGKVLEVKTSPSDDSLGRPDYPTPLRRGHKDWHDHLAATNRGWRAPRLFMDRPSEVKGFIPDDIDPAPSKLLQATAETMMNSPLAKP